MWIHTDPDPQPWYRVILSTCNRSIATSDMYSPVKRFSFVSLPRQAYYDLYDQMGSGSAVPDLKTVIPYVKRKVLQVTIHQII